MLVIRLRRIGKRNKPTYRVVLAEHTWTASGKFTADLGFYNPHTKEIKVDSDKIMEWLKKGAQPSNTVAKLLQTIKLKHASIVFTKKTKKAKKSEDKEAGVKAPEAVAVKAEMNEEGQVTAEATTDAEEVKEAETEVAEAVEEPAASVEAAATEETK